MTDTCIRKECYRKIMRIRLFEKVMNEKFYITQKCGEKEIYQGSDTEKVLTCWTFVCLLCA